MSLAKNLNAMKKKQDFTNSKLAEKSGVPKSTIDKLTSGDQINPTLITLKRIGKCMDCTLDDLDDELIKTQTRVTPKITEAEIKLVEKFRVLDNWGKKAVTSILNLEYERYKSRRNKT